MQWSTTIVLIYQLIQIQYLFPFIFGRILYSSSSIILVTFYSFPFCHFIDCPIIFRFCSIHPSEYKRYGNYRYPSKKTLWSRVHWKREEHKLLLIATYLSVTSSSLLQQPTNHSFTVDLSNGIWIRAIHCLCYLDLGLCNKWLSRRRWCGGGWRRWLYVNRWQSRS